MNSMYYIDIKLSHNVGISAIVELICFWSEEVKPISIMRRGRVDELFTPSMNHLQSEGELRQCEIHHFYLEL